MLCRLGRNGDPPGTLGRQGESPSTQGALFHSRVSAADAAVKDAGLTHLWERRRAGTVRGEATKKTLEKHR